MPAMIRLEVRPIGWHVLIVGSIDKKEIYNGLREKGETS